MTALDSIPDEYLWCRDVRHSWKPYDAKFIPKGLSGGREIRRTLSCNVCRTRKSRRMNTFGDYVDKGWKFDYSDAPGYLNKGKGRLSAKDNARLRILSIERTSDLKVKKR